MGDMSSAKNAAHGSQGLRDRYVKRGMFLAGDPLFGSCIGEGRQLWNSLHPRYLLSPGRHTAEGTPAILDRDYQDDAKAREQELGASSPLVDTDTLAKFLQPSRTASVKRAWDHLVTGVADAFWPDPNFPNNISPAGHPARLFVAACLHGDTNPDPFLPQNSDHFFDSFSLVPQLMPASGDTQSFERYVATAQWCFPLYPGMTVEDLKAAAPEIVDHANRVFATRTTTFRIAALANEGLSHQKIANMLGLHKNTVTNTLRSLRTTFR